MSEKKLSPIVMIYSSPPKILIISTVIAARLHQKSGHFFLRPYLEIEE